jgi:hypothetical protein
MLMTMSASAAASAGVEDDSRAEIAQRLGAGCRPIPHRERETRCGKPACHPAAHDAETQKRDPLF